MAPTLQFVGNIPEIHESIAVFNASANSNRDRTLKTLRQTSYWIFDENTQSFGPSKFVGFASMTFETYEAAVAGDWSGDRFDGYETRDAIEHATGLSFTASPLLVDDLVRWGENLVGPGAFGGVDESKWRFLTI